MTEPATSRPSSTALVTRPTAGTGIERPYTAEDVDAPARLASRSSTRSRALGAERLWELLHTRAVRARARRAHRQPGGAAWCRPGSKAIYLSAAGRWRPTPTSPGRCIPTRASTRPTACRTWCAASTTRSSAPTRSSTPRARTTRDWFAPIVADAEAGFGGAAQRLRADEGDDRGRRRRRALRGPARLGEEVRPHGRQGARADAAQFIRTLVAARLAADVLDVPTLLVARTDADSAKLLTSDIDARDQPFLHRRAHAGGLLPRSTAGSSMAIARGLAYAPYADLLWCETSHARPRRGAAVRRGRSTRSSRASCSPTTARRRSTGRRTSTTRRSRKFQRELGAMGYKFQFVTLAGFHALNYAMFELARGYRDRGHGGVLASCSRREFARRGATATRRRGTSARSAPATSTRSPQVISGGTASTLALDGVDRGGAVLSAPAATEIK